MKEKILYKEIMQYITRGINSGEYTEHQFVPNERELAELFGVSRITSKRALDELKRTGVIYRKKGKGSFVSPVKSSDGGASNNVVALVMPHDASASGMFKAIESAFEVLNRNGFFLTVHNTSMDNQKEKMILEDLVKRNVRGIILYPYNNRGNMDYLINLMMHSIPIVLIDRYYPSIPISHVVSDNFSGGYMASQFLIEKGHRNIAFFSNDDVEHITSARNRFYGYCKALMDSGISINQDIIFSNLKSNQDSDNKLDISDSVLIDIVNIMISKGVTAIQAINDYEAIIIQKICIKMGLRVPHDISIIGFDNIEQSKHVEVPLTTIEQDFYGMGKSAAEIITDLMINGNKEPKSILLPVKLIERKSTKQYNKVHQLA